MNDHQRESLSAHFDGEASPAERAEIERLLRDSPQAQAEWQDLASISNLLRSLPRHTLPDEFRAAVMQSAERATLLPPAEVVQHSLRRSRKWWLGPALGTAVAVAALLLVAVPNQPPRRGADAQFAANQREAAATAAPEAADAASADFDASTAGAASAPDDARAALRGSEERSAPALASAPAASPADAHGTSSNPRVKSNSEHLVFDTQNLTQLQIGDIVEAIDNSQGTVSIVHLTVLDRQEGLSALKLILRECKITEDPAAPPGQALSEDQNRLTAVYVESPREQLAAAIEQLNREPFREMEIATPVQVAQLHADAQAQLGFSPGKPTDNAHPAIAATAPPDLATGKPAALPPAENNAEPQQLPAPASADVAQLGDATLKSSTPAAPDSAVSQFGRSSPNMGRQLAFLLPADALDALGAAPGLGEREQILRERDSTPPPPLPQLAAADAKTPNASRDADNDGSTSLAASDSSSVDASRPVQVIFVLLDRRASREKSSIPIPPANKPQPAPNRNPGAA